MTKLKSELVEKLKACTTDEEKQQVFFEKVCTKKVPDV